MPRPTTRPPDDSPKREAILEAALELFAERGFHGTAVPLVAEKARVGAGTVYRYFESKEALVNALYQRWKSEMARFLLEDFPAGAPPREQFRAFWRRLTEFSRRYPSAVSFLERHHHAPYLDAPSRELEQAVMTPARAMLVDSARQQVTKSLEPNLLIALVYGAFVGILKGAQEGHYRLTPELLEASENCLWEAIRR